MKKKKQAKRRTRRPGRNNRTNKHRAAGNAREGILRAARKVFSAYSFKAATTRMIAQESGIDHPLIHYYFGSKERLFEAVTAEMYEEFERSHTSWLKNLACNRSKEGLSLYVDHLLDYGFKDPEPVQILLLNMANIGRLEEIPGYNYILLHLDHMRHALEKYFPLRGSPSESEMFVHCFHGLILALIGARSYHARLLELDPDGAEYREWVKEALVALFIPWLERLILPDPKEDPPHYTGRC